MDGDYNELAQYTSLWTNCDECGELVLADDVNVVDGAVLCWECEVGYCAHGLARSSECALCAAGVAGSVSVEVAAELKENWARTLGEIAEFLRRSES